MTQPDLQVMPYVRGGDLFTRISQYGGGTGLPPAEVRRYMIQLAQALGHLQTLGIAHWCVTGPA